MYRTGQPRCAQRVEMATYGWRLAAVVARAQAVALGVEAANVDRGLAGLADVGHDVDDLRHVGVLVEVGLPGPRSASCRWCWSSSMGPRAKPRAGRPKAAVGYAARGERSAGHEASPRDGLALECPRGAAIDGVAGLALVLWRRSHLQVGRRKNIGHPGYGCGPPGWSLRGANQRSSWGGPGPSLRALSSQRCSARCGFPSACARAAALMRSDSSATASRSPISARRRRPSA